MTNADSATTSINDNNLMNAESANIIEDVDPISKNSPTTIRNLHAKTLSPEPLSPPTQHPSSPSTSAQQATTTTNFSTATPSTKETLQVLGTSTMQLEIWRGNHQIHQASQNAHQQQTLDQHIRHQSTRRVFVG